MGYVAARIEELKTHLASLPPVDPATREITKLEAIRRLSSEIAGLQKKGYTIDEVAQFITDQGVPITGATLKQYLYRLKAKRARRRGEQLGENTPAAGEKLSATAPQTQAAAAVDVDGNPPNAFTSSAETIEPTPSRAAAKPAVNTLVNEPSPAAAAAILPEAQPQARPAPATVTGAGPITAPRQQPRVTASAGSFVPREDSDDI